MLIKVNVSNLTSM